MSTVGERESRRLALGPAELHPGYLTGYSYSTWWGEVSTSAVAAADVLYLYPFWLPLPATIKTLEMRTGTGGADSAGKCGIWVNSPVSNRPLGAPVVADETGQATTANNTNTSADVTDTPLAAGLYWAGSKFTGTLPTMRGIPLNNTFMVWLMGRSSAGPLAVNALSIASTYADAMPTIAEGASFTNVAAAGVPIIGFGA